MKTSNDFVRAIRARHNVLSDYALAKLLGITRSAVSEHKLGLSKAFGDQTGYRIAELLDLDPGYVLASLAAERAKTPEVKRVWQRMARAAGTAAVLVMAVFLSWGFTMAASPTDFKSGASTNSATRAIRRLLHKIDGLWKPPPTLLYQIRLLLLTLLLTVPGNTDDGQRAWSLQVNGISRHDGYCNGEPCNERNAGLGVQYEDGHAFYAAGSLINSLNNRSWYAGGGVQYGTWARAGVFAGLVTYPSAKINPVPALLPVLTLQKTQMYGVNALYIPPVFGITPAWLFQLKIYFGGTGS